MAEPNTVEAFTAYHYPDGWELEARDAEQPIEIAQIPVDPLELKAWLNAREYF